jgi:hypothetical protein
VGHLAEHRGKWIGASAVRSLKSVVGVEVLAGGLAGGSKSKQEGRD